MEGSVLTAIYCLGTISSSPCVCSTHCKMPSVPTETSIRLRCAGVSSSCPSDWSGAAFARRATTADVTAAAEAEWQLLSPGAPPPDRRAEPHDGWALSISRPHLWPVPDYSWRLLDSPLGSARRAPVTSHSAAGIKPSQRQRENTPTVTRRGEEKWGVGEDFSSFFPPPLYLIYDTAMTLSKRWKTAFLAPFRA